MRTIQAKDQIEILVDDEDFDELRQYRWTIAPSGYVVRWYWDQGAKSVLIHRQILGLKKNDGLIGDHINGNPLDNRRSNLRAVSPVQSSANVSARSSTGYRGVCRVRNRFQAAASVAGRRVSIGYFDTAEEAGAAAHAWRLANMPGYVDRPDAREVAR